jgi:predicted  nucleic acid-binding Zn-ribbon protein
MLADKTLQLEEAESALKTVRNNNSQLHESFAEAMEKSKNEQKESNEKIADLNTQVEMMTKTVQELQTSIDVRSSELHDSEVSLAKKIKTATGDSHSTQRKQISIGRYIKTAPRR